MTGPDDAPFAYNGLDRVLHERARLGILASLVSQSEGIAFGDLRRLCGLTDGNLNRHLKVLEEAGIVALEKTIEMRRPLTTCRLTPDGRRRFLDYLETLERVVKDAAAASRKPAFQPA